MLFHGFAIHGFIIRQREDERPYQAFRRCLRDKFPGEKFPVSRIPDHTYGPGSNEFDIPGYPLKVHVLSARLFDEKVSSGHLAASNGEQR